MWGPVGLALKGVAIGKIPGTALPAEGAEVTNADRDVEITVLGAGFDQGMVLVFVHGGNYAVDVIPVNNVVFDPRNGSIKLTGRIAPVAKNCGSFRLLAWLPPPGDTAEEGVVSSVNDVAVLADALEVKPSAALSAMALSDTDDD